MKALDFWMDMGVDAFRLDAIPYLFEREGDLRNLPETHEYLKRIRRHAGRKLSGACSWPRRISGRKTPGVFRQWHECHMAFHFPVIRACTGSQWKTAFRSSTS
jgi:maltose alpha-D-glucosyltransferase/alpha-amylase